MMEQKMLVREGVAAVDALKRKVAESNNTSLQFFQDNAAQIAETAFKMAERFVSGGRLLVMGNGGSACDAEHIVIEFMHPIFEKRQPLPSMSLSSNSGLLTAISNDMHFSKTYSEQIRIHGREKDIALAISTSGMSANLNAGMKEAARLGMLRVAFTGKDGGRIAESVDYNLCVNSYSIHRIQETHVMLLHTLWDLVHLYLGEEDVI